MIATAQATLVVVTPLAQVTPTHTALVETSQVLVVIATVYVNQTLALGSR